MSEGPNAPPMALSASGFDSFDFDAHFRVYHELMAVKVQEVLLVSGAYDAFILEQDGSLSARILNEYRGLNLSRPPRFTRVASGEAALVELRRKTYDLVISLPHLDDMDSPQLSRAVKAEHPDLPFVMLAHSPRALAATAQEPCETIDVTFIWSGDTNLLWALVKHVEDRLNVERDTRLAGVRVLLLVEDSPLYQSYFLPLIYEAVVRQTQAVIEESLNEEHRLLQMRARPKILLAATYEAAVDLYERHRPFIFAVFSDTRFPRECRLDPEAGFHFLSRLRRDTPHLPLLLTSSESRNRDRARQLQVTFADKNVASLRSEINRFFLTYLGFGDFVFRRADGTELGRAGNLRELEELLPQIPDEPIYYNARRNRFSNWIMARSEIALASYLDKLEVNDFADVREMRSFLVASIRALRRWRQRGVVVQFRAEDFDPDVYEFLKVGSGSLGGKARGLAFTTLLLRQRPELETDFPQFRIRVPQTLVVTTSGFDDFVQHNHLEDLRQPDRSDREVMARCLKARVPLDIERAVKAFLQKVHYPLSVRSSSMLEDAHFQPYAGLYRSFLLPNHHPEMRVRQDHLVEAIKRVWASTFFETPQRYYRNTSHPLLQERMAVIVQQAVGRRYGDRFYPSVSGVAQSINTYPVEPMRPEDGIVRMTLGMGHTLIEAQALLRFCPRYPRLLPGFSTVDEVLEHAQRHFYFLDMGPCPRQLPFDGQANLTRRAIGEARDDPPVRQLSSTYHPADHRLRDSAAAAGTRLPTFAALLKYARPPLGPVLEALLHIGRQAMGAPVEIEFSLNLAPTPGTPSELFLLQLRAQATDSDPLVTRISAAERRRAFCVSRQALGHGLHRRMADILYVRPSRFDPAGTVALAREIAAFNRRLADTHRPYLLMGPGRWGSADRWLGIPVTWPDIAGVGAIVELRNAQIQADPSFGTHFFQHITAARIPYVTVTEGTADRVDWDWLEGLGVRDESGGLRHVRLPRPFTLKIDALSSTCVMLAD